MSNSWTFKKFTLVSVAVIFFMGIILVGGTLAYIVPKLPSIDALKDVQLQVPLRIYTKSGALIAEFGEKKRSPARIDDLPEPLIQAILAAEDDRFYIHPGVDYQGLLRAVYQLIRTGQKAQGGSTITMQVARNFFLSREKTYFRKLSEILLALKIERDLSKNEILELYLNKMYMGKRAYGVIAAAQVYYGRKISELTIPEMAMMAGLYKAPSAYNPIVNPDRAIIRRNYVLGRMRKLAFISDEQYQEMIKQETSAKLHSLAVEVNAPYIAEMARKEAVDLYGNNAYTEGYKIFTTVDTNMQIAANNSVRKSLLAYDMRHGYRGPELNVPLPDVETAEDLEEIQVWNQVLDSFRKYGPLHPALVVATEDKNIVVYIKEKKKVLLINWDGLQWAKPYINENRMGITPKLASDIVKVGDIVRITAMEDNKKFERWRLAQIPLVEGALISINPKDGAINAIVGGFDYTKSKFNRVTQAKRQPGSNFKPFIYSAALDHGYTTATLVNDAPVVFDDPGLEDEWRPENYSGKFFGPTRLRQGLIKSRNLISIRLLRAIGIGTALKHVARFGFDTKQLPRDLSLALGSGSITPKELATGYAVFANGGYAVKPYLIDRIESRDSEVLMQTTPPTACPKCEETLKETGDSKLIFNINKKFNEYLEANPGPMPFRVPEIIADRAISPQNNYLTVSMMQDVIRLGTGRRARQLGRSDIAGKTGTTNDQLDAWFSGFSPDIVSTSWIGFDKPQPLGSRETGSQAALPMWIDFMKSALKNYREKSFEQPEGLVTVRIDPKTGLLSNSNNNKAIFETFRVGSVPKKQSDNRNRTDQTEFTDRDENDPATADVEEQLF